MIRRLALAVALPLAAQDYDPLRPQFETPPEREPETWMLPQEPVAPPDRTAEETGGATLRGLDRMTGVVRDIEMTVGETVRFERLQVTLDACRYPAENPTAAFALVTIRDEREQRPSFLGWLFAESPALSALDHPRYDVWLLDCAR